MLEPSVSLGEVAQYREHLQASLLVQEGQVSSQELDEIAAHMAQAVRAVQTRRMKAQNASS